MNRSKIVLTTLFATFLAGCMGTVSVTDLPENKHKFDMGPKSYSSYVHKTKVKFVDLDDQYICFDLVNKVELRNNTSSKISVDIVCWYDKYGEPVSVASKAGIMLKPRTSKLIKFTKYFKDTSVHGYQSHCAAFFL